MPHRLLKDDTRYQKIRENAVHYSHRHPIWFTFCEECNNKRYVSMMMRSYPEQIVRLTG